jgi:hypothetical protein
LARLKVWALIPATLIFAIITVIVDLMLGFGWGTIALTAIAAATVLQFSYLIGVRLSEAPVHKPVRPELLNAVQSAISEELRNHYEVPQVLSSRLRTRVAQLQAQYG